MENWSPGPKFHEKNGPSGPKFHGKLVPRTKIFADQFSSDRPIGMAVGGVIGGVIGVVAGGMVVGVSSLFGFSLLNICTKLCFFH